MSIRNEIKAQIVRAGFTMQEVVSWPMCWAMTSYGRSERILN